MTEADLNKLLFKKAESDKLAQVYMVSASDSAHAVAWAHDLRAEFTSLEDHPDVYWVVRSNTENDYKVDSASIKGMLKFINFKAIELKKRLIFFTDAHLMSDIVANKLLKVLEEMPESIALFLLVPEGESLLATVESRSIKLRLPKKAESSSIEDITYSSVFELINDLKLSEDSYQTEKKFIEQTLARFLGRTPSYTECADRLLNLKHYRESAEYNNAKASRLSLIFSE